MFNRREFLAGFAGLMAPPAPKVDLRSKPVRIAFGSCAYSDFAQPIWDTIAAANPDMFIFLGDCIYADTEDMDFMAMRYRELAAQPAFARFQIPIQATWDDHDFGVNDGGCDYPRRRESKEQFLNFFAVPASSPRRQRDGVYTSFEIEQGGMRIQVLLMDLRWWRSPLLTDKDGRYIPNPDPGAVLAGEEQWRWLEAKLREPADVRLLGSSIQLVSSEHDWEKWANFPFEKQRLYGLLDRLAVRNLIVMSGDMHFAELSLETTPAGTDIYDLTSSGLNLYEPSVPNSKRLALFENGENFGMITIDRAPGGAIRAALEARDIEGKTRLRCDIAF
jgi:alkaline phosphatase D